MALTSSGVGVCSRLVQGTGMATGGLLFTVCRRSRRQTANFVIRPLDAGALAVAAVCHVSIVNSVSHRYSIFRLLPDASGARTVLRPATVRIPPNGIPERHSERHSEWHSERHFERHFERHSERHSERRGLADSASEQICIFQNSPFY